MSDALRRVGWMLLLLCALVGCRGVTERSHPAAVDDRIVSLSPAVTETLFAIGLGHRVVAVSDYCHEPTSVDGLARVGTIFRPRYEAIVAARPTVIVTERIDGTNVHDLEQLGPTATVRWLSYEDVLRSTNDLGRRFGRQAEAARLVADYERALTAAPHEHAPRVLLALAHVPGQLAEIWYIRKNSIHGRALEAAGAINAVEQDVTGAPRMALERAVSLDPDSIIVLQPTEKGNPVLLEDYRRLTGLRAIREARLALVAAPELEVPGPRIVRLVERLRTVLAQQAASATLEGAK